jgi:hypothetical protein
VKDVRSVKNTNFLSAGVSLCMINLILACKTLKKVKGGIGGKK